MKQVSLGGLDVSWLGLGATGMSAFAENANRGDHALLLSPVAHVHAALLRSGVPGSSGCEPSGVSARWSSPIRGCPQTHTCLSWNSPVPELRRPAPAFFPGLRRNIMHPMFKELFIDTDADDLAAEQDRRHHVRRSRRARPAMIVRPAARNRENRSRL